MQACAETEEVVVGIAGDLRLVEAGFSGLVFRSYAIQGKYRGDRASY